MQEMSGMALVAVASGPVLVGRQAEVGGALSIQVSSLYDGMLFPSLLSTWWINWMPFAVFVVAARLMILLLFLDALTILSATLLRD